MCYFEVPSLLFYIYIPSIVASFLLGILILMSDFKNPINRNLFFFVLSFCFWIAVDLPQWLSYNIETNLLLVRASILASFSILFFLYFSFNFSGLSLGQKKKIILFLPFLPILLLVFTNYNAYQIKEDCTFEYGPLLWYVDFIIFVYLTWSTKNLVFFYKKNKNNHKLKRQLWTIIAGVIFMFLWSLSIAELANTTSNDNVYIYSPVGMVVCISLIAYAITKYQFLNIKVIAAGVLILTAWLLIFSQLFINNQSLINLTLTGITLSFTTVLGYMLFKAVKGEVKASEELTLVSRKLAGLNAKLEELDRAKSEFISIASHQLRTPLTSVKGFTSLILDKTFGKIPITQKKAVEKVFVNNEKLCLLVEDMLNASRLEAGRLEYDLEEIDIASVVQSTASLISLYAKSKGIKLTVKTPKEKLIAIIDQRKISEIISNLIDNAIKYTPRGSVTVSIEKFQREQKIGKSEHTATTNGSWARVSVRDTGIGMGEKQLESIFEKFKGGDDGVNTNSHTPPAKTEGGVSSSNSNGNGYATGTGLGVYISRQMAVAMGGKLYVASPGKGRGSTFILELPLVKK